MLIRLQLNPEGVVEQNIIEIVEGIARLAEKRKDFRVFTAHWLLIRHAQWLLKEEWATVKSEAAGLLRRIGAAVKRRQRAKAYQVFCTDDGSLAPLDKEPLTPPSPHQASPAARPRRAARAGSRRGADLRAGGRPVPERAMLR